jgi:hypothetical protein
MVYDQNGPRGYTFETEEGDYLLTPATQVVDQHVPGGGEVTWSIVGGGAALQVSFSGAEAIFGASGLQVHGIIHQHADFKNAWSCEVEEDEGEDESEGEQEVDPSGFVRSTTGIPLGHAKVTLQREGAAHKFSAPATGDHAVFDPAINPELSDQLGHYGWNVVPGMYRTTVSHPKCSSVVSRTVAVPPPVTNLSVRLRCHGLSRAHRAHREGARQADRRRGSAPGSGGPLTRRKAPGGSARLGERPRADRSPEFTRHRAGRPGGTHKRQPHGSVELSRRRRARDRQGALTRARARGTTTQGAAGPHTASCRAVT